MGIRAIIRTPLFHFFLFFFPFSKEPGMELVGKHHTFSLIERGTSYVHIRDVDFFFLPSPFLPPVSECLLGRRWEFEGITDVMRTNPDSALFPPPPFFFPLPSPRWKYVDNDVACHSSPANEFLVDLLRPYPESAAAQPPFFPLFSPTTKPTNGQPLSITSCKTRKTRVPTIALLFSSPLFPFFPKGISFEEKVSKVFSNRNKGGR